MSPTEPTAFHAALVLSAPARERSGGPLRTLSEAWAFPDLSPAAGLELLLGAALASQEITRGDISCPCSALIAPALWERLCEGFQGGGDLLTARAASRLRLQMGEEHAQAIAPSGAGMLLILELADLGAAQRALSDRAWMQARNDVAIGFAALPAMRQQILGVPAHRGLRAAAHPFPRPQSYLRNAMGSIKSALERHALESDGQEARGSVDRQKPRL